MALAIRSQTPVEVGAEAIHALAVVRAALESSERSGVWVEVVGSHRSGARGGELVRIAASCVIRLQ
jgi:hypothetical protein